MRSKFFIVIACALSISGVFAGCSSSRVSANHDALVVHGDGNVVSFVVPGVDIAARRAVLISPTTVSTKKAFNKIWGEAEAAWVGTDSPVSASLQLRFKLYTCLRAIIDRPLKRTSLMKDLQRKISVLAGGCPDGDVAVLEDVVACAKAIETAGSVGGLHSKENLARLREFISLKIENADHAYSLRWNVAGRRFSTAR